MKLFKVVKRDVNNNPPRIAPWIASPKLLRCSSILNWRLHGFPSSALCWSISDWSLGWGLQDQRLGPAWDPVQHWRQQPGAHTQRNTGRSDWYVVMHWWTSEVIASVLLWKCLKHGTRMLTFMLHDLCSRTLRRESPWSRPVYIDDKLNQTWSNATKLVRLFGAGVHEPFYELQN